MSARRALAYVLVGLAAYAAALVVTAPAALLPAVVEAMSGGKVAVRAPQGSLWRGSGVLIVRIPSGALLSLGPLSWKVKPDGIAAMRVHLDAPQAAARAELHADMSGVRIDDLRGELPASLLVALAPALEPWRPAGRIVFRSDGLQWSPGSLLGLADVEWRQAGLLPAGGQGLGSHVARLRGGGAAVQIELGTLDGPLRLKGGGSWQVDGTLQLSGSLEHDPARHDRISEFLQGVCAEYRAGYCGFSIRTRGS